MNAKMTLWVNLGALVAGFIVGQVLKHTGIL